MNLFQTSVKSGLGELGRGQVSILVDGELSERLIEKVVENRMRKQERGKNITSEASMAERRARVAQKLEKRSKYYFIKMYAGINL